jgi:hypothetical protein
VPPSAAQRAYRSGARAALVAFTTQVLLRPCRIGALAVLGGMIAVVAVGADGWWIVLGITLFQAAAAALTVMWVDSAPAGPPPRQADEVLIDEVLIDVPRPRRPGPGE